MQKRSRLLRIYINMKSRCLYPTAPNYKYYGGRGVSVCKEWADAERIKSIIGHPSKGWLAFKEWAMSNGYADNLTLDRIDCNKGYSPMNCRWVDMKTQINNRRVNRLLTYEGKTKTVAQWADELGINNRTILSRLRRGWSVEKALSKGVCNDRK